MEAKGGKRRRFTDEFKAGAVRLVLDEGRSVAQAARELGLTPSSLSNWVRQARADRSKGKSGLTTEERAELASLRKELRVVKMERDILGKSRGLLHEGERMRFAFISVERAFYPISVLCRMLKVSTSGFYASLRRGPSARASKDERLKVRIRESFDLSRRTYGSPRIHADLSDEKVGRNRIIKLMQAEAIVARVRRRYRSTTMSEHDQPVAANLLNRQFDASAPNQRWVGDTTEMLTVSGKFYLAAIVDLYARFVVGWAVSAVNDRHLTIAALDAALRRRCPDAGMLHHSDQGSTYASDDYQVVLRDHGITCSMSRRGNCHDNAAMESWFSTVKVELGETFESIRRAKDQLFDYIEVFYNQRRRHSSIAYRSPAEHEKHYRTPIELMAA
ncbi:MAG TPA: IS3 family transposase [Kofleriaceae bacterium]|nr:IS3 family transposase [Kofleriaceae bacterium]